MSPPRQVRNFTYSYIYHKFYHVKIYVSKIDEVGMPEFIEIPPRKLDKVLKKVSLRNLFIILDDMDPTELYV
ncbi:MAG: hypothetical protein ACK4SY_04365 [Pyrobaculum sp.]